MENYKKLNHFITPKTILMKHPVNIELVEREIGFPCIIKCISGSQGKGVFIAETKKEFKQQLNILKAVNENHNIIIQEFIKSSYGKDLRVYVLGGKPIACMLRKSSDGDFKANISNGGVGELFEINDEIYWLSVEATRVTGLDIAGVDLLFDESGYKLCEVNSNPGFKGLEKYTDVNIAQQIFDWIKIKG